jgi:hypothetical protein
MVPVWTPLEPCWTPDGAPSAADRPLTRLQEAAPSLGLLPNPQLRTLGTARTSRLRLERMIAHEDVLVFTPKPSRLAS